MTEKFDKALNGKLGIIVSIIFIISAIVTVVMAAGIRSVEIDNLKEKQQQLCEEQKELDKKKVDKTVYEIDIKYIKDGIGEIKESLKNKQ
jgi:FtsZ-binding cell division protein ZapB